MAEHLNIADLAAALVERANSAQTKTASAQAVPRLEHPLSQALKQAAAALRDAPAVDVSIEAVQKIASALPNLTGQAPGAASAVNAGKPTLPAFKTTNLGVTGGGGGVGLGVKEGSALGNELRKVAASLREQATEISQDEQVKAAHVLSATVGIEHLRRMLGVKDVLALDAAQLQAAMREGFLERLAQYNAHFPQEKVAISALKIYDAVEHGAASRTSEQLRAIAERAHARSDHAMRNPLGKHSGKHTRNNALLRDQADMHADIKDVHAGVRDVGWKQIQRRMERSKSGSATEKVAISFGAIGQAVEHGVPGATPGRVSQLMERGGARADSLRSKLQAAPMGTPRHDFLTNQLGKEHMLSQGAGRVQDEGIAAAEKIRAAQPTQVPTYTDHAPEAFEYELRNRQRLLGTAPTTLSTPAAPAAALVPKATANIRRPRAAAAG